MSKTFKFAGVATKDGVIKARFANDQMRVKMLAKDGQSDIDIIELKEPMSKEDAVAFLISINFDNGNAAIRAALDAELDKRLPKEPKAKREKTVKAEPSMESIEARAADKVAADAELEDAPF
jgi:hypothetical protein